MISKFLQKILDAFRISKDSSKSTELTKDENSIITSEKIEKRIENMTSDNIAQLDIDQSDWDELLEASES